ncbi:MAG: 2-phospho-L-lactate transferase [Geminicoccales bacterium]
MTTSWTPTPSAVIKGKVVAISGGIGGAKLALGLYRVLEPERLAIVANTGDDFEHLGLHVSPDIDTLVYTLAGLGNPEAGWGRAGESWEFMAALGQLGGETWFKLGDRDLAIHVERTRRLRAGESLSTITMDFARRLGIRTRILPMSDDPVRTIVHTTDGALPFQHYFVKLACTPAVSGIAFEGAATARPHRLALEALADPALRAVVLCPSNPYLSIDPILAMPGMRQALGRCPAPIVAVSPLIGGHAVKGPTAKIMGELGISPCSLAVERHYQGLLDGLVIDEADAAEAPKLGLPVEVARTLMVNLEDRDALARTVLAFAARLEPRHLGRSGERVEGARG